MKKIAFTRLHWLHAALVAVPALCLAAIPSVTHAAGLVSAVEVGASARSSDGGSEISSDFDDDWTTDPGETALATARVCAPGISCNSIPLPVPTWVGPYAVNAAARARTTYGTNQAQAATSANDEFNGSGALARSLWFDEVSFSRGVPGGTTSVRLIFTLDGEWENFGSFMFNAGLYDPLQSYYSADEGGTLYIPKANVLVSNGGEMGEQIAGGNWFNAPWGAVATPISGTGDADGTFDLFFDLVANVNVGQSYVLYGELQALGNDYQFAGVNAFNTGRLSAVVLEDGVTMSSAAGALDNYNVSVVPLPGAGWLLGTGVAFMLGRRTLARRRTRRD